LIKPFAELWDLHVEVEELMAQWDSTIVSQLNPEEVKTKHKQMLEASRKLKDKLENKDFKAKRAAAIA